MLVFKHRDAGLCLSFVVMVALAMSSSAIAFADSTTGTITITSGTLMETGAAAPALRLTTNGIAQTAPYALAITTTDATGSGSGWNLTITSTQFKTGATPTRTLSTAASSVTSVTAVCTGGQICTTMPQNAVTYPVAVPAGNTAPTAVKFYNASAASGIGTFDISTTIQITVPANTYSGTYTSTITLAYVSGP